jgi:hypothetical protein
LTDARQTWDDHVWQRHYVRVDGAVAESDMFRIEDNCTHCLEVADTGFPSGSELRETGISNGTEVSYQVVTPDGSPLVMACEQGSGAVRFRLESPADHPFRLVCRSVSPGPCRAVLAVCAGEDGPVYAVVSNDCAAGQWVTPAIRPPVSITQVYVRITLRDVPKAPTYFHDFVYVPDERRVNAINVNTATAGELQKRLGWPAALAEAVVARRPHASLAELREVPGMTDACLLDACGAILLRSDNWSVEIHSRTKDTPATRVTWMKRDAEAAGDRGYAPVSVVERRSVTRGR